MDRRTFLRTSGALVGALGAGSLLAACGDGSASPIPSSPDRTPTWNMINASFPELLVGDERRFAFGLTTIDNVPVEDPSVEVYVRPFGEEDPAGGPYDVEFFEHGALGLGVYLTSIEAAQAGMFEVVAVSGSDYGIATVNVVPPGEGQNNAPAPGDQAVSTRTPTFDDAMGFEEVCTRDPDCPLHERSLDELLADGRPILVMFATPAYCRTAVCGPAVDTFLEVRDDRDWGDLEFLHCEIFTDAGTTVGEPIRDWELPSEPWLFAIGADGTIVARVDGPMIRDELTRLAERLA